MTKANTTTAHNLAEDVSEELAEAAVEITTKVIEQAKAGDTAAMRMCLDRIYPAPKSRAIELDVRPVNSVSDCAAAMADLVRATARGEICLSDALDFSKLLRDYRDAVEASAIEDRISALEAQLER